MQQAYSLFNSGKYKEALNSLSTNPSNIDSFQPNLFICEYMANRCQQSAVNCLKKLNDIITRKYRRQGNRNDPQTENIVKFNIAVLMILQGKRDNAMIILREVYNNRNCFIEFMQTRILLMLLELSVILKSPFEALKLYRYYLLRPSQPKAPHQQWVSIIHHEHGKTCSVVKEEFIFMANVYINQSLMQIGAPENTLTPTEFDERCKQQLLNRIKRRKNGASKYYEVNVIMINRFIEAQKQLYNKNYQKSLNLMNFTIMSEEYDQMPSTKIITNILNGFATSNTGIIHVIYNKPSIALSYFSKAKSLLAKACTGVEDRQLHLLSLNYGNYVQSITYNQAVCLLNYKPKEAFQYFQSIRKNNFTSKSYKYWYRQAQSVLDYYHDQGTPNEQKKGLLQIALNSLNNCFSCIERTIIPTFSEIKNMLRGIEIHDDQIETIILRLQGELQLFKYSVYSLICYTCLGLQMYRKVINIGRKALQQNKIGSINRLNITFYIIQAQLCLGKSNFDMQQEILSVQSQVSQYFKTQTKVIYQNKDKQVIDQLDYESLYYYQLFLMFVGENNYDEAMKYFEILRRKIPTKMADYLRDGVQYLGLHFKLDKKYTYPFKNKT